MVGYRVAGKTHTRPINWVLKAMKIISMWFCLEWRHRGISILIVAVMIDEPDIANKRSLFWGCNRKRQSSVL